MTALGLAFKRDSLSGIGNLATAHQYWPTSSQGIRLGLINYQPASGQCRTSRSLGRLRAPPRGSLQLFSRGQYFIGTPADLGRQCQSGSGRRCQPGLGLSFSDFFDIFQFVLYKPSFGPYNSKLNFTFICLKIIHLSQTKHCFLPGQRLNMTFKFTLI